MPGRSKDEAFLLGNEIADAVTARNPKPMKLKFEKVSRPVPFLVFSLSDEPDVLRYFAGLPPLRPPVQEEIRRIQVREPRRLGACSRSQRNRDDPTRRNPSSAEGTRGVHQVSLPSFLLLIQNRNQLRSHVVSRRILFRTQDLSLVKSYLYRQWTKIIQGKISIQDFTFAKEVRLGTYRFVPSSIVPPIKHSTDLVGFVPLQREESTSSRHRRCHSSRDGSKRRASVRRTSPLHHRRGSSRRTSV